jgi:hypothetical protein
MTPAPPLRFFLALRLHAPYALIVLAGVTTVSVWTVALSPSELDSGLGMVLFIQIFLASSGFVPAARRGHFDPVLAGSYGRTPVAIAHWIVSIGPGVAAWATVTAVAYGFGSPAASSAIAGQRAAALFIVSAVAWSAGFALTRGAAGVGWIAALVVLLVRHVTPIPPTDPAAASLFTVLRHAATLMLCPFLLIGPAPAVAVGSVPIAVAASATVLIAICRCADRVDVPLRSDA